MVGKVFSGLNVGKTTHEVEADHYVIGENLMAAHIEIEGKAMAKGSLGLYGEQAKQVGETTYLFIDTAHPDVSQARVEALINSDAHCSVSVLKGDAANTLIDVGAHGVTFEPIPVLTDVEPPMLTDIVEP